MSEEGLPFRCLKCGAFLGQQRLHEADDYGPKSCRKCKERTDD